MVIRKIDHLGRLVLPKDIRNSMGLADGSSLEILATDEGILLKKYSAELSLISDIENLQRSVKDENSFVGQDKADQIQKCLQEALLLLRQAN
ncbi:AbrB/MazE/SpoVT family DNA-binding domain-containing protein [Clostridium boliviensis]|uniref:AbrB/MazE/SpoVT family DNA-binding domain-containing protein n=1 Tax=Clostridium boliviensis TaxID=318465 RepID=A0ABU4GS94_9CLOT|nr:AbrB/MazE/SpoVT family DNA-binding domain-containing protein [Clostridium boliviensis]MDW2800508.1 AbrB/MazE/SpoVT family DNA-binding domain-containing protein [Clostridium boliviensis]